MQDLWSCSAAHILTVSVKSRSHFKASLLLLFRASGTEVMGVTQARDELIKISARWQGDPWVAEHLALWLAGCGQTPGNVLGRELVGVLPGTHMPAAEAAVMRVLMDETIRNAKLHADDDPEI